MADPAAPPKLSLADVLHRLVDSLGLHSDTQANLHTLVADNVASDQEQAEAKDAAEAANPWTGKSDDEVLAAAFAGDQVAAEEFKARRNAPKPPLDAPAPAPAPSPDAPPVGV